MKRKNRILIPLMEFTQNKIKKFIVSFVIISISFYCFAQENVAENFAQYKREKLQFSFKDAPRCNEKLTLDDIKANQGYYMQNQMMFFQGNPRSSKLFKLHVHKEAVFLYEVDVIDSNEILIKQHLINYESNKWQSDKYQIKKYNNELYIFDYKASWNDSYWAYNFPFVQVCGLNQLMKCEEALSITTQNLIKLTGKYTFDSCYIMENTENENLEEMLKQKEITINYDAGCKSLVTNVSSYSHSKFSKIASHYTFSETETPFFWIYAEGGGGFSQDLMTFYKDGIALYSSEYKEIDSYEKRCNYSAFYKKNPSENQNQPKYYYLTTNLRIRDKPDLATGKSIITLRENSVVTLIKKGEKTKIDGIEGYWLNIRADSGSFDKDGNEIEDTIYGWCFGGYLQPLD